MPFVQAENGIDYVTHREVIANRSKFFDRFWLHENARRATLHAQSARRRAKTIGQALASARMTLDADTSAQGAEDFQQSTLIPANEEPIDADLRYVEPTPKRRATGRLEAPTQRATDWRFIPTPNGEGRQAYNVGNLW